MGREIIIPDTQAAARRIEAIEAYRSANDLAKRMPVFPAEQKQAIGRSILCGLRNWLTLTEAARFWEKASVKPEERG